MSVQGHLGNGLHDAEILKINEVQLSYDYHEKMPRCNYLEIELNSANALFDHNVKAVRFYNYKIIEGNLNLIGTWWFDEQIETKGSTFIVKIQFRSRNAIHKLMLRCLDYELIKLIK